jgi:hypothetical protein
MPLPLSSVDIIVTHGLREKSERSFRVHLPPCFGSADTVLRADWAGRDEVEKLRAFLAVLFEHRIWHRIESGSSSCINHANWFHGAVNQMLSARQTLLSD